MLDIYTSPKKIIDIGYAAALFLTFVGVVSALSRYLLPHELHLQIANALYGKPYADVQFTELAKYPVQELLHRVIGSVYLLIGLLQFTPSFRKRNWQLHRTLGRIFVIFSFVVGIGGIYMGFAYPFAGWRETLPTVLYGSLFLYFVFMGYLRARQRNIKDHQLWMIRSFSLALGIATIRIVVLMVNTSTDIAYDDIFVFAFWFAWTIHLILTELGIYLAFTRKARTVSRIG